MASIKDVAALAKVSISTVSLAMNYPERVSDLTKERIFAAIKQLHYTPLPTSRNVHYTGTKKKTVALLTSIIFGPYFFEVMRGINETLEASNVEMIILSGSDAVKSHFSHIVRGKLYSGVILIGNDDDVRDEIIAAGEEGYPTLMINSTESYPNIGTVGTDQFYSGQMMANHLLHIGYRNFAVIGARDSDREERVRGFKETLQVNGVSVPEKWDINTGMDERSGTDAVRQMMHRQIPLPEAVFCLNDEVAIGAINELKSHGIECPRDIAVTGYDDIPICKYFLPELTTISTPKFELGVLAASSILRQINGGTAEDILTHGKLVIRESCGYKDKKRYKQGMRKEN